MAVAVAQLPLSYAEALPRSTAFTVAHLQDSRRGLTETELQLLESHISNSPFGDLIGALR
ncbi:MAG TPA: hypothetical protein VN457_02135 [Chlamydiales bacterium]|nr:hypothetical protein [Chlamydiales bacterium]